MLADDIERQGLKHNLTKNGEKKGIRVDTLAKQFGEKFTKVNLEKKMGYYIPKPEVSESKAYQKRNKTKSKEKSKALKQPK